MLADTLGWVELTRRDARLYVAANGLGSFGLGVTAFYLNFLYRALGFGDARIGSLASGLALGAVVGALPATLAARRLSRRATIIAGGTVTGAGVVAILLFDDFTLLLLAAALIGFGGVVVSSSGSALVADATSIGDRPLLFGQAIALATTASFLASSIAGALAAPLGALLGRAAGDPLVLRVLIGAGGLIAASSIVPILFVRSARVRRGGHDAPARRAGAVTITFSSRRGGTTLLRLLADQLGLRGSRIAQTLSDPLLAEWTANNFANGSPSIDEEGCRKSGHTVAA